MYLMVNLIHQSGNHPCEYSDKSDSPSNTRDDVKSPTEITILFQQMRSLENLSLLPPGDTLFKCHIAPRAFYIDYEKDIILGCHLFHLYFDGDGKRRPPGSSLDWGITPRFQIQFHQAGNNLLYQGARYYQVFVNCMAGAMEGRWREETQAIGDLTFRTFFLHNKY